MGTLRESPFAPKDIPKLGRPRTSTAPFASEGSDSSASTADLSPAVLKVSSLLQRRGRKSSTLSPPGVDRGYRETLADDGYDLGSIIGRSSVNQGFCVIVASKAGRSFAVKGTHEGVGTGVFAATLRNEFDVLRGLSHPGLVRAEAFVNASGGCAMVMELCPGVCLEQLMPQGSALCGCGRHAVLERILDAVAYLHGQQVAHRDLHALNIMVDAFPAGGARAAPSVKIVDFGSARQEAPGCASEFRGLEDLAVEILPPDCASRVSAMDLDVFAVGLLAVGLLMGRPMLTADVLVSAVVSVPEGFLMLSSAGRHHLEVMLALRSRPTAYDCHASLPPSDRWLA